MTGREVVVYPPQDPAPPIIGHPRSVYEIAKATQCNALVALPSFVEVGYFAVYIHYSDAECIRNPGMVALARDNFISQDALNSRTSLRYTLPLHQHS